MLALRVEVLGGVDHLRQAAARILHQHVRQHDSERLVADQFARAPDGVAEAERRLLAGEAGAAGAGQVGLQKFEVGLFAALDQCHFEFELTVEVILDHAFVAPGDENDSARCRPAAPRRPRAGSAAGRPPAAFPSASPWWRAGNGCRGRRRGRWLCGYGSWAGKSLRMVNGNSTKSMKQDRPKAALEAPAIVSIMALHSKRNRINVPETKWLHP